MIPPDEGVEEADEHVFADAFFEATVCRKGPGRRLDEAILLKMAERT